MTHYQQTSSLASGAQNTEQAIQYMQKAQETIAETQQSLIGSQNALSTALATAVEQAADENAQSQISQGIGQIVGGTLSAIGGTVSLAEHGDISKQMNDEAQLNEVHASTIENAGDSTDTLVHVTDEPRAPESTGHSQASIDAHAKIEEHNAALNDRHKELSEGGKTQIEKKLTEQEVRKHAENLSQKDRTNEANKMRARAKTLREEAQASRIRAQKKVQYAQTFGQSLQGAASGVGSSAAAEHTKAAGEESAAQEILKMAEQGRAQAQSGEDKAANDNASELKQMVASQAHLYSTQRG